MPAHRSRTTETLHNGDGDSRQLATWNASGGIAFAPNVTPGTFTGPSPPIPDDESVGDSLLFPVQAGDSLPPRKSANSRKKPENYIPRPPNAFILFRSAFIRNQHVSTGVETNHSTLSKIIGLTWQNLPNEERQLWHRKAKIAEDQHRKRFPQYAFKPLHGKNKAGGKRKVREVGPKDHKRCAKIAELLVQGKKGKDLDEAIKEFDKHHVPEIVTRFEAPITEQSFQRSPSAPIPEVSRRSSRRKSNASRHCSMPASIPSSPNTQPSLLHSSHDAEQGSYLNAPPLDQFLFASKDDTFDFNAFSFNSVLHSSQPLYTFDSHLSHINHLNHTITQASLSQPTLLTPDLPIDMEQWSRCNSPSSPGTSGSMPTTPAYGGAPLPPTPHPSNDSYGSGYTLSSDYTLDHDKSFAMSTSANGYTPYSTPSMSYQGAAQFVPDSHHPQAAQCGYEQPSCLDGGSQQTMQVDVNVNLDYSAFMSSYPM